MDLHYLPLSPRVLGTCGEELFIFKELDSTGNYFKELAHSLGTLGAMQKSIK